MNTKDIQKLISQWHTSTNEGSRMMEEVVINIIDHIWKLHQHVNGVRSVISCHQQTIQSIIQNTDNILDMVKDLQQQLDQLKRVNDAHIETDSAENPQETPKSALYCGECCGNCVFFANEDADGVGACKNGWETTDCSSLCCDWQHRPLHDGDAVLWKQNGERSPEAWKLGYYCSKAPFGHNVRDRRDGGTAHKVGHVIPFDTFNPYKK